MEISYVGPYPLEQAVDLDAGYDITANADVQIYAKTSTSVPTGLSMAIPRGYYGRVASRSGLSFKHSLEVGAGIIDSGYRGEIKVHLYNFGDTEYFVRKGDRIAQIIILKHESPVFTLVSSLSETKRGGNGFGHSG